MQRSSREMKVFNRPAFAGTIQTLRECLVKEEKEILTKMKGFVNNKLFLQELEDIKKLKELLGKLEAVVNKIAFMAVARNDILTHHYLAEYSLVVEAMCGVFKEHNLQSNVLFKNIRCHASKAFINNTNIHQYRSKVGIALAVVPALLEGALGLFFQVILLGPLMDICLQRGNVCQIAATVLANFILRPLHMAKQEFKEIADGSLFNPLSRAAEINSNIYDTLSGTTLFKNPVSTIREKEEKLRPKTFNSK